MLSSPELSRLHWSLLLRPADGCEEAVYSQLVQEGGQLSPGHILHVLLVGKLTTEVCFTKSVLVK